MTLLYLNCLLVILNVAELSQALADFYAGWFFASSELFTGWIYSYWTVYWFSWMLLNCHRLYSCKVILATLSEMSFGWLQSSRTAYTGCIECCRLYSCNVILATLSELSIGWLESYWTVYWLLWMLLNSNWGWFYYICTVFWVIRILLNCMLSCIEWCWTVTGSSWTVCRVISLYLNCLLGYLTTYRMNLLQLCCLFVDSSIRVFGWMHNQGDCFIRVSWSHISIGRCLLFYNSLIFNTILFFIL